MSCCRCFVFCIFVLLLSSNAMSQDKSITFFDTHYEAIYGQTALCRYIAGSRDSDGDGTVNWYTSIVPEAPSLDWCTMAEWDSDQLTDPGTSVTFLELMRPAPADDSERAYAWISVWLRTLPLEVDRLYEFDVKNMNESSGMVGTGEILGMDYTVLPCPIHDLVLSVPIGDESACQLEWGETESGDVEVVSYSIYRGLGAALDAQNYSSGTLVVDDLEPAIRSFIDHPPTDGPGYDSNQYIYTVFGKDSSGKIVARSEPTTFVDGPVLSDHLSWGHLKSMFH